MRDKERLATITTIIQDMKNSPTGLHPFQLLQIEKIEKILHEEDDELDELDAEIIQGILQLVDIELSERHKEMTQKEIKLIHNIRKMAGYEDC